MENEKFVKINENYNGVIVKGTLCRIGLSDTLYTDIRGNIFIKDSKKEFNLNTIASDESMNKINYRFNRELIDSRRKELSEYLEIAPERFEQFNKELNKVRKMNSEYLEDYFNLYPENSLSKCA